MLADDLGYGELGSYGQTKIRTPFLDQLAAQGIRFSQHYSGSPVCAPSRGTLLTATNIKERLATRDLLDELRSAELVGGGPSTFGARDTQAFANELNRFLQANP